MILAKKYVGWVEVKNIGQRWWNASSSISPRSSLLFLTLTICFLDHFRYFISLCCLFSGNAETTSPPLQPDEDSLEYSIIDLMAAWWLTKRLWGQGLVLFPTLALSNTTRPSMTLSFASVFNLSLYLFFFQILSKLHRHNQEQVANKARQQT